MSRGLLIAIEGADGSGKSRLSQEVLSEIEVIFDVDVELTHEPYEREVVAAAIEAGADPLAVYESDRHEHWHDLVYPALCAGRIVLMDRYYLSTAIYQATASSSWESILMRQRERFAKPDMWVLCSAHDSARRLAARTPPEEHSVDICRRYDCARHALEDVISVYSADASDIDHNASRVAWEIMRLRR